MILITVQTTRASLDITSPLEISAAAAMQLHWIGLDQYLNTYLGSSGKYC